MLLILKIWKYALRSVKSWTSSSKSSAVLCYCASWCPFNLLPRHNIWADEANGSISQENTNQALLAFSCSQESSSECYACNIRSLNLLKWNFLHLFLHYYSATRLLSKPSSKMNRKYTKGFLQASFLLNYLLRYSEDWGRYCCWNIR